MNFKKNINRGSYPGKYSITTSDTGIEVTYYHPIDESENPDVYEAETPYTVTYESLKTDHYLKTGLDTHNLVCYAQREGNAFENPVLEFTAQRKKRIPLHVFKHSLHDRAANEMLYTLRHPKIDLFYVTIPYADSPVSEWTFIFDCEVLIVDGETVTDTIDTSWAFGIGKYSADNFLPSITLTRNMNDFTATVEPAKEGVTLYFETTTGYLSKNRATTDANGQVTTTLNGYDEGKVKVGFKFFPGKDELEV
jgi:hypothetical protein